MKTFLKYVVVVSLACMVFACGDDETDAVLTVAAADKAQAFDVAGGSKTVIVTASAAFTAKSDQTWCTVSGVTLALFKLNVAENTAEERTAKVTVELAGATSIEIVVTQAGVVLPPAILMVQPEMLNFTSPKADELIATVATNRPDYDVIVTEDWVTYEKTSDGLDQLWLKIKVAPNYTEDDRTADVTVHVAGATDATVHVMQPAGYAPADGGNATYILTVAAPGTIEWYTRGTNKTIGTPTPDGSKPSTVAGPGSVQAWALGKDDHIKVTNPLAHPTTIYTLLWDVRVPNLSGYCSILQTKEDNNDGDGDVFFNSGKVGLGSYSAVVLKNNTWHRVIASVNVDATTESKSVVFYVDGYVAFVKDISSAGDIDRYTLQTIFWLFLDDGNEVFPLDFARFVVYNKALTKNEVLFLGDPTTAIK
jgi:hypothetical protein